MIPQFILDMMFERVSIEGGDAYWGHTFDPADGYIVYWPDVKEVFHTYRYPPDWLTDANS
jgi:hypothetical protein